MSDPIDCPAGGPEDCPLERRKDDPWRHAITERMDAFDRTMAENTAITKLIKANTEEIVAFFEAGKGFFQVVRFVGTVAKWVTTVAAALVVFWFVFRHGVTDIFEAIRNGKNGGGGD